MSKTKIVCTLGPATDSDEGIRRLIEAGADVIRLNFSHGDLASHGRSIEAVRRIAEDCRRPVAILQDLQGPKIRLGDFPDRILDTGSDISLAATEHARAVDLPVTYPWLSEDVRAGDRILLADGTVELEAIAIEGAIVHCRVVFGGAISSRKGVNLPGSDLRIPSFTEKDREDLRFGCGAGVDLVALSFVRHEDDIEPVRSLLQSHSGPRPLVIAKIEKPQAVRRLDPILRQVDGVMVARGDLGVEVPVEDVPMIQKRIIRSAQRAAKPVITATQMLRSMVESPRPTRAEASDVANAVIDGTDAVMLSEESAVGRYPIEAVRVLKRVCEAAETGLDPTAQLEDQAPTGRGNLSAAIAKAACVLAHEVGAVAIVATTTSGSTARLLARYRPHPPVVGLTTSPSVQRQLTLSHGVLPALTDAFTDTDDLISRARRWCTEHELAQPGEIIVVTAGLPIAEAGTTNLIHAVDV